MGVIEAVLFFLCIISPVELSSHEHRIGAILVSDKYPRCKDVNLHTERLVCEIHSQEDEMKIERFGLSGCYGSTLSCAEGDIKTCMPLMISNTLHYQCYCHLNEQGTVVSDYYWTLWGKNRFHEFIYNRKLFINNDDDHVADEYRRFAPGVQYVVANNSLPDSVFTASSHHVSSLRQSWFIPKRARIDNYFDLACAWASGKNDRDYPWLKISLPDRYQVIGVYIKQRCDYLQYPTVIDVTTSVDDVLWQDVVRGEDIATRYSSYDKQGSVRVWFSRSYTTRYWKVYIPESHVYPSLKCDLLSYVTWTCFF